MAKDVEVMPVADKILITVETQTSADDYCSSFIPEFECKRNDCRELDSRIAVTLDKLESNNGENVVIRNFEAPLKWQPKKRWKIASHAVRAAQRFGKRKETTSFNNLTVTNQTLSKIPLDPQRSGIYVFSDDVTVENKPPYDHRKRFSLTGLVSDWKNKRKERNEDIKVSKNDRRHSLQSFSNTSSSTNRDKFDNVKNNQVKDTTLLLKKKYNSQNLETTSEEYKPLIHEYKSRSMYDMKTLLNSVDSFDKFCPSPRVEKKKQQDTQSMNGTRFRQRNRPTRSFSTSSRKSRSSQDRSSFSSDKKEKENRYIHPKDVLSSNDELVLEKVARQSTRAKSKRRPASYFWDPREVVAEICEMERQQEREEQVYPQSARSCHSYYDLQRDVQRERSLRNSKRNVQTFDPLREGVAFDRLATPVNKVPQKKENQNKLVHSSVGEQLSNYSGKNKDHITSKLSSTSSENKNHKKLPLSTDMISSSFEKNKERNVSAMINDKELKYLASSKEHAISPMTDKINFEGKILRPIPTRDTSYLDLSYLSTSSADSLQPLSVRSKTKSMSPKSGLNSPQNQVKFGSCPKAKQNTQRYKNGSTKSDNESKDHSRNGDDLTVFALVPGTNLHRKLSMKGISDRAPINVLSPSASDESKNVIIHANNDKSVMGIMISEQSRLAKRKSFHSADDLACNNDSVPLLQTSFSADDIDDHELMLKVSARRSKVSPSDGFISKADFEKEDEEFDEDCHATYV